MGKKKKEQNNDGGFAIAYVILGLMALIVCGILVIPYYIWLKSTYVSPSARRINDFGSFSSSALIAVLVLGFPTLLAGIVASNVSTAADAHSLGLLHFSFAMVAFVLYAWVLIFVSEWLAAVHLGTIVDSDKNRIIFRVDQESYDLVDYVTLRFVRDLPKLDEIPISAIDRITRQSGLHLYLLGDFGSRRISFSNKQKRDECIYAITSSGLTKAKVFHEFEST
jgi:hypothetical protein